MAMYSSCRLRSFTYLLMKIAQSPAMIPKKIPLSIRSCTKASTTATSESRHTAVTQPNSLQNTIHVFNHPVYQGNPCIAPMDRLGAVLPVHANPSVLGWIGSILSRSSLTSFQDPWLAMTFQFLREKSSIYIFCRLTAIVCRHGMLLGRQKRKAPAAFH